MWSRRIERINELLLQEISRVVVERQDPDIGFVTFTGVEVTEDLMQAKVFYSVLGSEDDRLRTAGALEHMRHEIHQDMRRLESLKRIPTLVFIHDQTPQKAARVFELIEQIHQESQPVPPEPEKKPVVRPASRGRKPASPSALKKEKKSARPPQRKKPR
ncbi:MAG TPA: 30S ribosome-binding factor RbfA [Elusimicrobiota bacterium]|nr:30S ribosome-binding factor RbfA [Elusimicrobiota bacterium]